MKLFKNQKIIYCLVIALIMSTIAGKNSKAINDDINKGVTLILNPSINPFSMTSKMLAERPLFNYKIDFDKNEFIDLYQKTSAYSINESQFINDFSILELKRAIELEISGGQFPVSSESYISEKIKSAINKRNFNMQIYLDLQQIKTISIDHNKNFPSLNNRFLLDTYKIFFSNPNKRGLSTAGDLFTDKNYIRKVINYFDKYGTHYASSQVLGNKYGMEVTNDSPTVYKTLEIDGKMVIADNNMTGKLDSSIETDRVSATIVRDVNAKSRYGEFFAGECKFSNHRIQDCKENALQLVHLEARPLYFLFDPFLMTTKLIKDKKEISKPEIKAIYSNMKRFHFEIERALDVKNLVVVELLFWNLEKSKSESTHPCIKKQDNILMEIINYKKKMHKAPFSMNIQSVNKFLPVMKIENYEDLKTDDFAISVDKSQGFYMCAKKEYNLSPTDITKGQWLKKDYIKDVKFLSLKDENIFTKLGYICKLTWQFTVNDEVEKFSICVLKTNNFLNRNLVQDIQFFSFPKESNKCNAKHFSLDYHGKLYVCDCEYNVADLSTAYTGMDMFLCLARKSDINYIINKPINKKQAEKERRILRR